MSANLEALYARIPAMECKPGCTDCCGPVPARGEEVARAPLLTVEQVVARLESGCIDCPYSAAGNCAIYPYRPFLCRLFGTAPGHTRLTCPHGCAPEKPLAPAEADSLADEYLRLTGGAP